jgi:hypothetical protein
VVPSFFSNRNWRYSVALFPSILIAVVHHAVGLEPEEPNLPGDVTGLISDYRCQFKDETAIDKRQAKEKAQVSALIAIIDAESKSGGDNFIKHRALRELERFPNSEEAIRVLVREIQFEPPMIYYRRSLATYTAADVLQKMGSRARHGLFAGLSKPLSDPELNLRAVVLVRMDGDGEMSKLAKEIAAKRLRNDVEMIEQEAFPAGQLAEQKTGTVFNLKRMIAMIEDPHFSAGRIPDPIVPEK